MKGDKVTVRKDSVSSFPIIISRGGCEGGERGQWSTAGPLELIVIVDEL